MSLHQTITSEIERSGGSERLANIIQAERLIMPRDCKKKDCAYCAWVAGLIEKGTQINKAIPLLRKLGYKKEVTFLRKQKRLLKNNLTGLM